MALRVSCPLHRMPVALALTTRNLSIPARIANADAIVPGPTVAAESPCGQFRPMCRELPEACISVAIGWASIPKNLGKDALDRPGSIRRSARRVGGERSLALSDSRIRWQEEANDFHLSERVKALHADMHAVVFRCSDRSPSANYSSAVFRRHNELRQASYHRHEPRALDWRAVHVVTTVMWIPVVGACRHKQS